MRCLILFLCSTFSLYCNSQNLKIKTIEEFSSKSIPNVKILVLDEQGQIVTIEATNDKGLLKLQLELGSYTIKASHLSYEKWSQNLTQTEENQNLEIKLTQKVENLQELVISSTGYLRKHGDTTTISLPKIVNGKERNVIDVLKKIKGLQVLDDGTVVYNKKEITDVLINGNKIFDNDYKSVLDKIKPYEMVKIQFIENYKDDTNSNLLARKATAMNLGFKNKFFISGTIEAGVGISTGRIANINLLQNASWITTFLNVGNQNTGVSKAYVLSQDQLLNTNITPHYSKSQLVTLERSELDKIKATDFNNTYTTQLNTSVKLSKKIQLLIKSNNTWEDLERLNSSSSLFIVDNQSISRNESNNQKVNYSNSENSIGILHKSEKSILKSEFYFKNIEHDYQQRIDLNGEANEQFINESRQLFNLDLKYEKMLSDNTPLILNAGYHYLPSNQSLTNIGSIALNQSLEKTQNVYYTNASLLKRRADSSIVSFYLGNKMSDIEQNIELQDNSNTSSTKEQLITNELKLSWEKETEKKDWNIKVGYHLYSFNIKNNNIYSKGIPFFDAHLKLKNKSKVSHTFTLNSNNDWILKNPFTPFFISDSFNSSYSIQSRNDIIRKSNFSYLISGNKNLDNSYLSININHNSNSLISKFNINRDTSQNTILITDKDNYRLNLNARYNTLLWKLFFFELNITPSLGNAFFIDNNDVINETINRNYSIELKINRRFTQKLFIGSTTQVQYSEFETSIANNDILNYNTNLYFTWEFGNFELKGDYNHIKLGNNNSANFSSLHLGYTPKKGSFTADFQLFNLFNTKSITTSTVSNIGEFSSLFNLPERRFITSISYTF